MRKGGGKQKGAQFEREVCVLLSRWMTDGERDDIFWRSAMSGGRATVAKARGKSLANQVGDISCIDPIGHEFSSKFAVECKYYASLDYQNLLIGKGKLSEFWEEIIRQANSVGKCPMIFAKENRFPTFIGLNKEGLQTLNISPTFFAQVNYPHDLYLVNATKFFDHVPPYR